MGLSIASMISLIQKTKMGKKQESKLAAFPLMVLFLVVSILSCPQVDAIYIAYKVVHIPLLTLYHTDISSSNKN